MVDLLLQRIDAGDLEGARHLAQERVQDPVLGPEAWRWLGRIAWMGGQDDPDLFQTGMKLALQAPAPGGGRGDNDADPYTLAGGIGCDLALCLMRAGRMDEAWRELWTATQRIQTTVGSRSREGAFAAYCRGMHHLLSGENAQAQESFAEAALRLQSAPDPHLRGALYCGWGQALLEAARLEAANHYLTRAWTSGENHRWERAQVAAPLARLRVLQGDLEAARRVLMEGLALLEGFSAASERGQLLMALAEVGAMQGDFEASARAWQDAHASAPDARSRTLALLGQARLLLRRFDYGVSRDPSRLDGVDALCETALQEMASLERATDRDPLHRWADSIRGRAGWRRNFLGRAVDWDGIAARLKTTATLLEARGHVQEAAETRQDLLALLERWISVVPGGTALEGDALAEVEHLMNLFERMGASDRVSWLEDWLRVNHPRHHMRMVLGRFVPVSLTSSPERIDTRPMVAMLVDVRGFSRTAREVRPHEVFQRMSELFRILNNAVADNGGTILRYFGDGLLTVFDDSTPTGSGSGPVRALQCALSIVAELDAFNIRRLESGHPRVEVGIGIHFGDLAVGRVMARGRWEYTAHGDVINMAAHMEQRTKELGVSILASEEVFRRAPTVPCRATLFRDLLLKHGRRVQAWAIRLPFRFRPTFVGFGEAVPPVDRALVLDVGGDARTGIVDHHHDRPDVLGACAASLVLEHPEWVLDHFQSPDGSANLWSPPPEFILHRDPDLDCCSAAWIAQALLEATPASGLHPVAGLPAGVHRFAEMVRQVDQGRMDLPPRPETCPYMLFTALAHRAADDALHGPDGARGRNRLILARAMHFVDHLIRVLTDEPDLDPWRAFHAPDHPFQAEAAMVLADWQTYRSDLERSLRYRVRLPVAAQPESRVDTLLVRVLTPASRMFKSWTRAEGSAMQHVTYDPLPSPVLQGSGHHLRRHVISVDPSCGAWLPTLGARLQEEENGARERVFHETGLDVRLKGKPRKGYASPDPWYDGRGHGYTIVDAPNSGSILTADQVHDVLVELYGATPAG